MLSRSYSSVKSFLFTPPFTVVMLWMLVFLTVPAKEAFSYPWDTENTVANALLLPDGQNVVCEQVVVDRIVARQEPAYFIVRDIFNSQKKIVVLCRPPIEIRTGQSLDITGTTATLTNGEKCIISPVIYGYFDGNNKMITWSPVAGFASRQMLSIPESAVLPCDPAYSSLAPSAQVTAERIAVSMYPSVESILSTNPAVLSPVELVCKPVKATGEGFIMVGDDKSISTIKVFTNSRVSPTDRIVRLSGTVHTEGGSLVIYADDGPEPYFDPQGYRGHVSAAGVGTTAYAATLDDGTDSAQSDGAGIMSAGTSDASDGSWVYLTGKVVTSKVPYWSQSAGPTGAWINVIYIQGIDGTPGIRVFPTAGFPDTPGSVVDVMGKLSTTDHERSLGYNGYLDYKSHPGGSEVPCPLGMANKSLGGASLGNNPGITDGEGLYNIGSLVKVWGRVEDYGDCNGIPFIRINDGSKITASPSKGIGIIGGDAFSLYDLYVYQRYVSVTGVSSLWMPDDPNADPDPACPAIWILNENSISIIDPNSQPGASYQATNDGIISGTVYLYDGTPGNTVNVKVYCSDWQSVIVPVTLDANGCGSGTYSITNISRYYESLRYIVSAECDGFKTRTYTDVTPDTEASPQVENFHLVPLKKLTVTADNYTIGICPETASSSTITARVVNSANQALTGVRVRFWTNKGTLLQGSNLHTIEAFTDENGVATAILYSAYPESGTADVWVTDDINTPSPVDGSFSNSQDLYKYDWEKLAQGIYIPSYTFDLSLSPTPLVLGVCENQKQVSATLKVNGQLRSGVNVHFTTTSGTFLESGTNTADTVTVDGVANVTLVRPQPYECGEADISAEASVCSQTISAAPVKAVYDSWKLNLRPLYVYKGIPAPVTVELTKCDSKIAIEGQQVILTASVGGVFGNNSNVLYANTDGDGKVTTTLTVAQSNVPVTVIVETTAPTPCNHTFTDTQTVTALEPDITAPVEIFFCQDSTGSMGGNTEVREHGAHESIADMLRDLNQAGIQLRLAGMKFNDPVAPTPWGSEHEEDSLDPSQLWSFQRNTTDVNTFINTWIWNGYSPKGGDEDELQLDTLHKAVLDINAYSNPRNPKRYIVLVTDYTYHENKKGSEVTRSQVLDDLYASGCRVYISLWPQYVDRIEESYRSLTVRGEIDPVNEDWEKDDPPIPMEEKYPFDKLRTRILAGQ